MYSIKKIENLTAKIKLKIRKFMKKRDYEKALTAIAACARVLYLVNQTYTDDELENCLSVIAEQNCAKPQLDDSLLRESILFYDGFGLDNRGLVQIYLTALTKIGRVIYVTRSRKKDEIPTIAKIIRENSGEMYFVDEISYLGKIRSLQNVIETVKPHSMFFYSLPDDVAGTVVFNRYKGVACRFQINLTDHAFWLGKNVFDYCIEFRNYGASISKKYRQIPESKIVLLPFYPVINENCEFEGFPCSVEPDKTKVVFSGGALYKTFGDGNKYYKIVRYILSNYRDTIFWYAGSGNTLEMERLANDYPNRVFLTKERKDIFQVLQRCYFYLSTYPISGGLMFQYAARAGKIPLTLKYDDTSDNFLIDQEKLGIEYENEVEFYAFLDAIMRDEKVVKDYAEKMKKSVISSDEFNENLRRLIFSKATEYEIQTYDINTDRLRETYLQRISKIDIYSVFRQKSYYKSLLRVFPREFVRSCFYYGINKWFGKKG